MTIAFGARFPKVYFMQGYNACDYRDVFGTWAARRAASIQGEDRQVDDNFRLCAGGVSGRNTNRDVAGTRH